MRIPPTPPSESSIFEGFATNPGLFATILGQVGGATYRGRYIHWDKLRFLVPPAGLTHEMWWFGLKLRRAGLSRPIPLRDKTGKPFRFSLVDPLPQNLHLIDLSAGGSVLVPEPVLNPETKDRYIVRSLIEESITSSQLEGAATTREVAKKMLREGREPRNRSEQMIMNNYRTMRRISSVKKEPLTKKLVFEIHSMVTRDTLPDSSGAGRFRRPDERIAVTNQYEEVLHEPPSSQELDERLELMCEFANDRSSEEFVHPAIRSMILHFWLAYDHPFVDGNGRTARALFYWSMLNRGYWLSEFISISEIILRAPAKYGRSFLYTETDGNDLTYFLVYHAEIVRKAVQVLHGYVEKRSSELRSLEAELRGMETLNYRQRDLISHALRHPGQRYTIESHRSSHNVVYQTARVDLLDLQKRGLLKAAKVGRTWIFTVPIDLEDKLKSLD